MMINPRELRIGNIIWESNSFTPGPEDYDEILVASINDIDKVVRDDQENGYSYDALYGIPLTPEWLGRAGFVKFDYATDEYLWRMVEVDEYGIDRGPSKAPFAISQNGNSFTPMNGCGHSEYSIGNDVQHVHQIQNLYFALTGEELQFKL